MLKTEPFRAGRRQWNAENPGLPHPLDVAARLAEFREMQDGWADGMQSVENWGDGYGKAPDHAGLDWLADSFERHYPDDLPLPYTYPTPEGGVQMEWSLGPFEISLEINLDSHLAEWFWVEIPSDAEGEKTLNLDDANEWAWLANELQRLAGSTK